MKITADLRTQALLVAATVDPDTMTGNQAASVVADLATAHKALGGTLLFCALQVAKTDAWTGQGHKSAADWLSAKVGISVWEANRQLGTAKKASRLPKTKDAIKRGDLSPDEADAITDAASVDPDAEDDLLAAAANDTNKALRDKAARAKAAATDSAERERRIRRNRSFRRGTDPDGAFWTRSYGPGVDAAAFEAMLRPYEEIVFRHHRKAGIRSTHDNRAYDAHQLMLAHLASQTTAGTPEPEPEVEDAARPSAPTPTHDDAHTDLDPHQPTEAPDHETQPGTSARGRPPSPGTAGPSGSPDAAPPPDPPDRGSPPTWRPPWDPDLAIPFPAKTPGGNNIKVIVLVDHTALLRGHAIAGETCEIAGIGPISAQAAREILLDDPFLAVVVRRGRDIVNVAHHGRSLNAHQRTAIEAAGFRCTNIACNRTIAIEIDHRNPYATDPITELHNQDPHCPDCHRLKTHHGHHLEEGTGPRRLLPPGHPDNPVTGLSRSGSDQEIDRNHVPGSTPGRTRPPLPYPAPTDRPLTDDEVQELEQRIRARLDGAGDGTPRQQVTQPSLC